MTHSDSNQDLFKKFFLPHLAKAETEERLRSFLQAYSAKLAGQGHTGNRFVAEFVHGIQKIPPHVFNTLGNSVAAVMHMADKVIDSKALDPKTRAALKLAAGIGEAFFKGLDGLAPQKQRELLIAELGPDDSHATTPGTKGKRIRGQNKVHSVAGCPEFRAYEDARALSTDGVLIPEVSVKFTSEPGDKGGKGGGKGPTFVAPDVKMKPLDPSVAALKAETGSLDDFIAAGCELCPLCFPDGVPKDKPKGHAGDGHGEHEPKGRKDKYGTEVMNVITAAKNRLAKRGRDLPFAIDQLQDWPSVDADSLKATCAVLHGRIVDARFHPETGVLLGGELTDADLDRLIIDIPVDGKENLTTVSKLRQLRDGAKQLLGYAPKEDDLPLLEKYSFKLVDFLRATELLPKKTKKSAPHLAEVLKVPDLKHLEEVARANWTPKFHETLDFKDAEKEAFDAWDTAVHMLVKGHEYDQERKNPTLHKAKPFILRTAARAAFWSKLLFVLFVIGWSTAGLRFGGSFDTSAIGLYVALGSGLALMLIVIAGLLPVELTAAIGDVLLKDKNRIDDTVKSIRQTLMITLSVLIIAVIPAHLAKMPFWWYFPTFVLLLMASMAGTAALEKALAFETLRRSRHMLGLALGMVVIVTLASLTVQALRKLHPDAAAAIEAKAADLTKKDDEPAASQADASATHAAGDTQEQLNQKALDALNGSAAQQPAGKQAEAAGKPKSKAELERLIKLVEDYKKATAEKNRLQNQISKLEKDAESETDPQKLQQIEDAQKILLDKLETAKGQETSLRTQLEVQPEFRAFGDVAFEKKLRDELKALQGTQQKSSPPVAEKPTGKGNGGGTKAKDEDKPQVASSDSLSVEAYCKGLPNKFRVGKCEKYKG